MGQHLRGIGVIGIGVDDLAAGQGGDQRGQLGVGVSTEKSMSWTSYR
jgi:hypothetical protein